MSDTELMNIEVTGLQIEDIKHALGWSHTQSLNELGWRNHYYSKDPLDHLDNLVSKGLMERVGPIYRVTKEGCRLIGISRARIEEIWKDR